MSRSLGIPVKILHEASGHIVSVELKSGELYRGSMIECEDNWNCQLENITYTAKVDAKPPGTMKLEYDGIKCGDKSNGSKEEEDGGNGLISDSGKACRGTGPQH
ncbi:hypothetical protein BUALT_BualtUnG0029800 [Buddleja alternifolia]|uniref:Small nuclear ribonucleoprotein Sm D3 n=1 Tax=Buddleja alternifolia TaxID=168488 RepID=A0AAV6VZ25_9LAMI|nr:hypothetical protein BUALT_BualtUnG0029800 [Buddleja alternifolia]